MSKIWINVRLIQSWNPASLSRCPDDDDDDNEHWYRLSDIFTVVYSVLLSLDTTLFPTIAIPEGWHPWICLRTRGDVPAPFVEAELGVLTETSGHPQLCLWRLKRGAVLSQNTSTLEKNSTYHGRPAPHWERLNRDRYVRCSLICGGPNHCEAHGWG